MCVLVGTQPITARHKRRHSCGPRLERACEAKRALFNARGRREEIGWAHSEGVYEIVPMQCRDAGMKPLDLIWVGTDKSVETTRKKIRSRLSAREYKTKKQGKIQRAPPASQMFSAMPPLEAVKVLVSIMMSVSVSNKGKPLKLRHYDISRAHFQGKAQRLIHSRLPAEDRQKYSED